jgi:hypothetical protein
MVSARTSIQVSFRTWDNQVGNIMKTIWKYMLLAMTVVALLLPVTHSQENKPNSIDQSMYFRSFIQDRPGCEVKVENGKPVFNAKVSSPAAACPDAFAWTQFLSSVKAEFWTWGTDQTVWPSKPLAMCTETVTTNCCDVSALTTPGETPPTQCPYNREDYPGKSPLVAVPAGAASSAVLNHGHLTSVETLDPGRLLRDVELEFVFRNRPMVDYIFENDLYNSEGLVGRLNAVNTATGNGNLSRAHELEVRFPTDAIMAKADFLHQDILLAQGLIQDLGKEQIPNHPDYPYVTMYVEGPEGANDPATGYYYMLAMTNASKDLPSWHWYVIEHVSNIGRCDYIGCNDSFGYDAKSVSEDGAIFGTHFIPPMVGYQNDKTISNDPIFITGEVYNPDDTGEMITANLAALYKGMGIASAKVDSDPKTLSPSDPAWLNYRMKGTQTQFTTSTGVPTGMGATITEGGFVNSASCMSCHSQATTGPQGAPGIGGVGNDWRPNLFGFTQKVMGAPDMDWFFNPGTQQYDAYPIDFVWGILGAQCVNPGPEKGGPCASYPSEPSTPPAANK